MSGAGLKNVRGMREGVLVEALRKIILRATPHVDDTDEDRRRDLYHIDAIARRALEARGEHP